MRIRVYTDGACSNNPGPGGWGAVFCTSNSCKILRGNHEHTTNNRMELKAVVESFKYILKISKDSKEEKVFELFSDSAYVVNAIVNDWLSKWQKQGWKTTKNEEVKNKDLWVELIEEMKKVNSQNIKVDILKIKGHNGNTFNELVDKIAKEEVIKVSETK